MTYLVKTRYNHQQSSEYEYVHDDSLELHEGNKLKLGPTWRFHDHKFTYKMNSHGYRMNRELEDIDQDNYIAFFGCSFTVGIGLPLEETFAHRIAQRLNLGDNYVNGAVSAASPSFVGLNITHFFKHVRKYPRVIVVNWPPLHRIHYWRNDTIHFHLPNFKPNNILPEWQYWREAYETTILEDSHVHNTFQHIVDTVATLCRLAGVQLVQISTGLSHRYDDNGKFFARYPDIAPISRGWETVNNSEIGKLATLQLQTCAIHNDISARDLRVLPDGRLWGHPGTVHQNLVVDHFFKEFSP